MTAASFLRAFSIALILCFSISLDAGEYDLSPQQVDRFKTYLPRSYDKLSQRRPFHAIAIGDSVMNMYGHDENYHRTLGTYYSAFLEELAKQFYYAGGIRDLTPAKNQAAKLNSASGDEITLQNFSRGGRLMFHALQPLSVNAFENQPDLVMIGYGINDANAGLNLDTYRQAIVDAIALVKRNQADLILFAPTLTIEDPPEEHLARVRPFTQVMREVAQEHGVLCIDLGDLAPLIRLDERDQHLREFIEKNRQKAQALAEQSEAPTEIVTEIERPNFNPLADVTDPDPDKAAVRLFNRVVSDYRQFFNHGAIKDFTHPDAELHQLLGRRVYQELLNGETAVTWNVSNARLVFQDSESCILSYQINNLSDKEQLITLLPLIAREWIPVNAPTELTLKAGKSSTVNITWKPRSEVSFADGFNMDRHSLCLSILHSNGDQVRIDDINALIQPVTLLWGASRTEYNLEEEPIIPATLYNTSAETVSLQWRATWQDQTWTANAKLAPGESKELELKIKIPENAVSPTQGIIKTEVIIDGKTLRFDRRLELVRNIGLSQTLPLYTQTQLQQLNHESVKSDVNVTITADDNALYFSWIVKTPIQATGDSQPHLVCDVNLDARSYGQRMTSGVTDAIRITSYLDDQPPKVNTLTPWVFGLGYKMSYDTSKVVAKTTKLRDGSHRLTLGIPRSYLYLHEWKIDNGNSQIGVNTSLLISVKDENNSSGYRYENYFFTQGGLHRDQADNLTPLELSKQPTKRWNFRIY